MGIEEDIQQQKTGLQAQTGFDAVEYSAEKIRERKARRDRYRELNGGNFETPDALQRVVFEQKKEHEKTMQQIRKQESSKATKEERRAASEALFGVSGENVYDNAYNSASGSDVYDNAYNSASGGDALNNTSSSSDDVKQADDIFNDDDVKTLQAQSVKLDDLKQWPSVSEQQQAFHQHESATNFNYETKADGSTAYKSSNHVAQNVPKHSSGAMKAKKHSAKKKGGPIRALTEFVIVIGSALILAFFILNFVAQPYTIPSGSMEDTIQIDDRVFSEKISYYFGKPKVGDIVTFIDTQDESRTLIKRVIATGGQTVDIQDGVLYVDGVKKSEKYVGGKSTNKLKSNITYPYVVPQDHIWVMGDNRTNSQDSRYFGSVPLSNVTGHAFLRYWPLNSIGLLQ